MNAQNLRKLAEKYEASELEKAEEAILAGETPDLEIDMTDPGAALTDISGALWIKRQSIEKGCPLTEALRAFTQRVRTCTGGV